MICNHENLSLDPQKPTEMADGYGSLAVIPALEGRGQRWDPQGKLASKIDSNQ